MIFGGLLAVLCVGLGLLVWAQTYRIPLLTDEAFDAARRRWNRNRVTDYEIEITVTGRQPSIYSVRVRDGVPVSAERNGALLPQRRVWTTWTVDGMFQTIQSDIRSRRRRSSGDTKAPELLLRAQFDETLGIPLRYVRVQLGQSMDVSWKVTRSHMETKAANARRQYEPSEQADSP
jgi:hypothetical protein